MYIELIFLINYVIDFLILLGVSIILRRRAKIKHILFTSMIGSISLIYLYIDINNAGLFAFKICISTILNVVCFGYKDIKYTLTNIIYFYSLCFILGGSLYYLKIEYSYVVSYKILLLLSPLIIFLYTKQALKLKNHFALNHKVDIYLKDGTCLTLTGYMDSANTLIEPYKKRKVIIINDELIINKLKHEKFLLVPYSTISGEGLIKCIIPKYVYIEDLGPRKDVVIGIIKKDFDLNGVGCILNYKLMEGI